MPVPDNYSPGSAGLSAAVNAIARLLNSVEAGVGEIPAAITQAIISASIDPATPAGSALHAAIDDLVGISITDALQSIADPNTAVHDVPSILNWDQARYPVTPTLTTYSGGRNVGSIGRSPAALFTLSSPALATPATTLHVAPTGDDAAVGSQSAPLRSIGRALTVGNAGGGTYCVKIAAGDYANENGFNGVTPTQDAAIVITGGSTRIGRFIPAADMSGFVADTTWTNLFKLATATHAARVLDLKTTLPNGLFRELTEVATRDIANRTPGTFVMSSGSVWVNPFSGVAPTALDTLVTLRGEAVVFDKEVNVYFGATDGSPVAVLGGANSWNLANGGALVVALQAPTNAARKIVVVDDISFDYAGHGTYACNGITVYRWYGLVALFGVSASGAAKDGINIHNNNNSSGWCGVLKVNCRSVDSGRFSGTSFNSTTLHDDNVFSIDIAGYYTDGRGGTVHNIENSKEWFLGAHVANDHGDIAYGGPIPPNAVRVGNTATILLTKAVVDMPMGTIAYATTAATATIKREDCAPVPQRDFGPGVFSTFSSKPIPRLLDQLGIGAAFALSFRKLRDAYTGPCVRLQRADGQQADIGFAAGRLDWEAVTAFAAGSTPRVVTWYDQSGNGRHFTSSYATAPGIGTTTGYPALGLPGTRYLSGGPSLYAAGSASILAVASNISTDTGYLYSESRGDGTATVYGPSYANNGAVSQMVRNAAGATAAAISSDGPQVFGAALAYKQLTTVDTGSRISQWADGNLGQDKTYTRSGVLEPTVATLFGLTNSSGFGSGFGTTPAGFATEIIAFPVALATGQRVTAAANQKAFYGTP